MYSYTTVHINNISDRITYMYCTCMYLYVHVVPSALGMARDLKLDGVLFHLKCVHERAVQFLYGHRQRALSRAEVTCTSTYYTCM